MNLEYILILVVLVSLLLVLFGTVFKTKWGINIKSLLVGMKCPKCGADLPKLRIPEDKEQANWGGSTCPNCKTKVDKWGRTIQ